MIKDCSASTQASLPAAKKDAGVGSGADVCSLGPDPVYSERRDDHTCFRGYCTILELHESHRKKAMSSLACVTVVVFEMLLDGILPLIKRPRDVAANMLLLFLMKLRLNLTFSALGVLFAVQPCTASQHFYQVLAAMLTFTDGWIFWPSSEAVKRKLPLAFQESYPKCRAIVDCAEIPVRLPAEDPARHAYFNRHGHHTVKFVVATAPCGTVTFVSKVYSGGSTDSFMTSDSGFLDLLEPGDVILSEKGFPCTMTSFKDKGVNVVVPPFVRDNKKFSEDEDLHKILSVQGHVERCMERLKRYRILSDKLSSDLFPHLEKVAYACAVLTNLKLTVINPDTYHTTRTTGLT